jgi:nitroreductase
MVHFRRILIDDKYINPKSDMLIDFVLKNRSYRRFDGKTTISADMMEHFIELARLCPSSRNQQALKFIFLNQPDHCEKLYPNLAWAGYLKEWDGPGEEERPTGYIIILGDTTLGSKFDVDLGICAQTILLGAVEKELGGCMIASIKREEVRSLLQIDAQYKIVLVIALGKPIENVVVDSVINGEIKYWRDLDNTHHVPKRRLSDVLIKHGML